MSRRTFVITNILHTCFIPYKHLYTNFSVRTFTYVFLSDKLLRTNILLTNVCIRNFSIQTFLYEFLSRRTFVVTNIFHTYFIPYEHLYTIFSVRTFAYALFKTNFISYEHLFTKNCVRTISIRSMVLQPSPSGEGTTNVFRSDCPSVDELVKDQKLGVLQHLALNNIIIVVLGVCCTTLKNARWFHQHRSG